MNAVVAGAGSQRAIVGVAALGTTLLPLNSTMVAVALPDIVDDLGSSIAASAWLVSAYLIAQAALQPASGKLGDRFGRRPLIVGGLSAFGLVSLGAALAPTLGVLIVFRVLQAAAGALVFPNALGLIREFLPEARRGHALGMLGAAIGVAAAVGPPVGGVLVAVGGWRAIFLVNLPLVAAALWLALRSLPAHVVATRRVPFDTVGAAALTALLAGWAWVMNPVGVPAWGPVVAAAVLAVLTAAFVRYELGLEDPVLQPRFLRVRVFAAATGSVGLSNLALYGTLLTVPVLLSQRAEWTHAEVGLVLVALSLPIAVLSPFGGRLADRAGRRAAAVGGLGLVAAGLVPLALAGSDVTVSVLIVSLAAAGAGIGLSNAAVQAAALEALAPGDAGIAAGIFSTGRYLGGIAAASLVAALANHGHYGALFGVGALAALGSMLLATALPGRLTRKHVPAPVATR